MNRVLAALALVAIALAPLPGSRGASAAEATTGAIIGTVVDSSGTPLSGITIQATSPSGRYTAVTDGRGRFVVLGVQADTYEVAATKTGFDDGTQRGLTVLAGQEQRVTFRLAATHLQNIGSVRSRSSAFTVGATADTFVVSGDTARARAPIASSSGLGSYSQGTVQGSIASVPGVDLDPFGNALVRGGRVSDLVFEYNSVPIPQGLIAEPGGNVDGAQLPTTGIASTITTLAGYSGESDNALGGVVNQIPAVGTYPGSTTVELGDGIGTRFQQASLQFLSATPDLKWRYALAATTGSEYFKYGDGSTFYPSEAATYGLALQSRAQTSVAGNVHYQATPKDDLAIVGLFGEAQYDQYGSPFPGETVGEFDGSYVNSNGSTIPVTYPGESNPDAPVTSASGIRGSYNVLMAQWSHSGSAVFTRLQGYETRYASQSGGPFWDENGFPDGSISLAESSFAQQYGINLDNEAILGAHHLRFGAELRTNTSYLNQVVPTAGEFITSNPTVNSELAYFGDTWSVSNRFDLMVTGRYTGTHFHPSDGPSYDTNALDPHVGASYRIGSIYAARVNVDHITVAPAPLEADRTDSTNTTTDQNGKIINAPFVPLAAQTANDETYSFEGGGKLRFRATYYRQFEQNLIDVLPFNFRSAVAGGLNPDGLGVPTNVGSLRSHGVELNMAQDGFTFNANFVRAFSSSASQFAYNDLNAPAIAAGHLFPVSYEPDLTTSLSYQLTSHDKRLRVTPSLAYATGYPYGNGKLAWVFDADGKPEQVPNDNYVNPGANYYFLADPSQPHSASNPYIGNLGTNEGSDPNTLRSTPQTYVNLHLEADISKRLTLIFDVANILNNVAATAYQVNPYLIGPPGYKGGNPAYAAYYGSVLGTNTPYTLGNGIPTNDGQTQAVPWSYGTDGYIAQGFPNARTAQLRLRYRL